MEHTMSTEMIVKRLNKLKGFDLLSKDGKNAFFKDYKYSYPFWEEYYVVVNYVTFFDRFIKYKILQPIWKDLNYTLNTKDEMKTISKYCAEVYKKIENIANTILEIKAGNELWDDAPIPEESYYLPDKESISLFFESIDIKAGLEIPVRFDLQPNNDYNYLRRDINHFKRFLDDYLKAFIICANYSLSENIFLDKLDLILKEIKEQSKDNSFYYEKIPMVPKGKINLFDLYCMYDTLMGKSQFNLFIHESMQYIIENNKNKANVDISDQMRQVIEECIKPEVLNTQPKVKQSKPRYSPNFTPELIRKCIEIRESNNYSSKTILKKLSGYYMSEKKCKKCEYNTIRKWFVINGYWYPKFKGHSEFEIVQIIEEEDIKLWFQKLMKEQVKYESISNKL
jgi:hypothetical protein